MTNKDGNCVDFGIITIREDEFLAVLQKFPKEYEITGERRYNISHITANGTKLRIAVMRCQEEGTGEAQSATRDLIDDLNPACIMVVGIAGGLPADEFSLGDVVVSTRIHDFTISAARQGKSSQFQVTGGRIDKEIGSLVANFKAMDDVLGDWYEIREEISRPKVDVPIKYSKLYGSQGWKEKVRSSLSLHFGTSMRTRPIVYAGPIASSDTLIKDADLAQVFLGAGARKCIAVEMEMAGCYRACFDKNVPCLSVRGISDIVGLMRDANWTTYACKSAASFTHALIRTGMLPHHFRAPGSEASVQPDLQSANEKMMELTLTSQEEAKPPEAEAEAEAEASVKAPTEVFTPRNPMVNELMYVDRPDLETALWNALRGSQHVILHGESGSGKSWLYKRVLAKNDVYSVVANLGNASRFGSIIHEIYNATFAKHPSVEQVDILEICLRELRAKAGKKQCCLVLDNLEYVRVSQGLMKELGEILVLLDDQRYAEYQVKFLIVGVPGDVRDYFSKTENTQTISNRLKEVPEVSRLAIGELSNLVRRGFVDELGYATNEKDIQALAGHVAWVSTRIPQRVHEYCLEFAFLCEKERVVDLKKSQQADHQWLLGSLSSSYSKIQSLMNDLETKVGRRNQVLYALGFIDKDDFRYGDVETVVRKHFPTDTKNKTLNISGILSALSSGNDPLIRRTVKGDAYVFTDPKWRMCLRATLRKVGERVGRLDIGSVATN